MTKKKVVKKKVAVRPTEKPKVDMVACERELRKYVRRDGGYCKGITENDKKRAQELLKMLGRKGQTWDGNIVPIPQKNIVV